MGIRKTNSYGMEKRLFANIYFIKKCFKKIIIPLDFFTQIKNKLVSRTKGIILERGKYGELARKTLFSTRHR